MVRLSLTSWSSALEHLHTGWDCWDLAANFASKFDVVRLFLKLPMGLMHIVVVGMTHTAFD
jgi:hypothetical protein